MIDYSANGIFSDFTYGCPTVSKGLIFAINLCQNKFFTTLGTMKILVVGSGNGYELVYLKNMSHQVTGLDLYVPDAVKDVSVNANAADMPFKDKEFDLVFCSEMLEHVLNVDEILSEFRRVAYKFFISIATEKDPPYNAHINIQTPEWWLDKLSQYFTLMNFQFRPLFYTAFGRFMHKTYYHAGVYAYGFCSHLEIKARPIEMEPGFARVT